MKKNKMKFGLMGAWNVDSGAAIHTEILGRSLIALGHKLTVFTYMKENFHGTTILREDEDFVYRCFTTWNTPQPKFNALPFLTTDYQYFIAEDHGMFPLDSLGKIFHWIKRKAKTLTVIHDAGLKEDASFYQFDWDAIVCFDDRYRDFLVKAYPKELVHIIPHPCLPWRPNDKQKARQELNLPLDKKIVFLFGQTAHFGVEIFSILKKLSKSFPLKVLIVSKFPPTLKSWQPIAQSEPIVEIRQEAPDINKLYQYLYAADTFIYHKPATQGITIASSIFQCLGSGCPIVANKSNFTYPFYGKIMLYDDFGGLEKWLAAIFNETKEYQKMMKITKQFVTQNSGEVITKKIIGLLKKL
ncbi:MAG: hypothetical protein ABIK19_04155 [candidate division WOR-3 bacterium]